MRIESDEPIRLGRYPEVSISVTNADGQHAATPLDYESWERVGLDARIKCYDANGQVVFLTVASELIYEIALGRIHGE